MSSSELSQRSLSLARLSQHSAVRFLIVGGLSVGLDALVLFLLHGVAKMWLPLATLLAFATAFALNFGLNRAWAFSANDGAAGRQVWRYVLLSGFNVVATVIGVSGLTALGLPYLISKLVTSAILAIINYITSRWWIFI